MTWDSASTRGSSESNYSNGAKRPREEVAFHTVMSFEGSQKKAPRP